MRFNPLSEKDLKPPLLERGDYDAEMLDAKDEVSKNGNQTIHFMLKVYSKTGKPHIIHDYLMFIEGFAYKVRHFCYANGLENEYEAGFLSAEIAKKVRTLRVRVGVEVDKSGQYDDKNRITDYLPSDPNAPKKTAETAEALNFDDTDIPF